MKKILSAAAALIICIGMGTAVSADVIFEPMDDFYRKHAAQIVGTGRGGRFYTISEETNVYSDPGGNVTGTLSPGRSPCISYYYTDKNGAEWGGYYGDGDDEMLWICLDGAELIYDGISFSEEHIAEFYDHKGEYDELKIDGSLLLYEYPGSTEFIEMKNYPSDFGSYIHSLYTDENGSVWGHIGYIWGCSGWVCAEQAGGTLAAANAQTETEKLPSPEQTPESSDVSTEETLSETNAPVETEISQTKMTEPDTEYSEAETSLSEETESETAAAHSASAETFSETVESESAEASSAENDLLLEDSFYTEKRKTSDYVLAGVLSAAVIAVAAILFKVLGKS